MPALTLHERRVEYGQALDAALDKTLDHLIKMPEVEKVILFGSYAAGRRDLFADLDIIVVMETERDFVHRSAELYRQVPIDVDMDLLVYTPEEFERQRQGGFVGHALATGRVIYEKQRH